MAVSEPVTSTPVDAREPEFSRGYTTYAVGLLVVVYIFNFVDRQILNILLEEIGLEFALTDAQRGLLGGIAFGIFYSLLGIPIARWADRSNRSRIIAVAIFIWSLMTAVTGAALSFLHLFLARVGVGVGEAGCSPPAHSILSDYLHPERRATALSIYALGVPIGTGLGLAIGGVLADAIGWRLTFVAVGVPGIVIALLVQFTLREPTRGYWDSPSPSAAGASQAVAWQDVVAYMWRFRSFRHLSLAAALHALYGYGAVVFNPAFFQRTFELNAGEVGIKLGLIAFVAGGLGTFLGGYVSDWLQYRDRRWYMWVPAIATIVVVPLIFPLYLNADAGAAFVWATFPAIAGGMYLGPTFAMTQTLAKPAMRALAAAVLLLIINLVGLGLGPYLVGFVSDQLRPTVGDRSIAYALLGVIAVCATWSTLHYALAARTLREDLAVATS